MLALAGCGRVEARSLAKEGNALYREGRFAEALSRFSRAADLDPGFSTAQLHIGYTQLALSQAARPPQSTEHARHAARAFTRYMGLRPHDERGPRFYLQALLDGEQLDEALRFLEGEHRRHPQDLNIIASLGVVSSKAGRFEQALGWYEKRAALLPSEAKARYLVGTLCWEHLYRNTQVVGAERVRIADRGIAALEAALERQPGYGEALVYANLLYRERAKGQTDAAAKAKDMEQAQRYYRRGLAQMKGQKP